MSSYDKRLDCILSVLWYCSKVKGRQGASTNNFSQSPLIDLLARVYPLTNIYYWQLEGYLTVSTMRQLQSDRSWRVHVPQAPRDLRPLTLHPLAGVYPRQEAWLAAAHADVARLRHHVMIHLSDWNKHMSSVISHAKDLKYTEIILNFHVHSFQSTWLRSWVSK